MGAEPHPPYTRPALSKGVLTGADDPSTILLPPLPAEVEQRAGAAAVALDHERRELPLDDGERIGYDGLVPRPEAAPPRSGTSASPVPVRSRLSFGTWATPGARGPSGDPAGTLPAGLRVGTRLISRSFQFGLG